MQNYLKEQLHKLCMDYADKRMEVALLAIQQAQEAANDETKSSAGDKYETGRAMMQREADLGQVQLAEARKLKNDLDRIDPVKPTNVAQPGSLVFTDQGIFYIAISAGQLSVGKETAFAISGASPLGSKLIGKKAGAGFELNGKLYNILKII
jgi:transcription elongation GreA/GreB family factor